MGKNFKNLIFFLKFFLVPIGLYLIFRKSLSANFPTYDIKKYYDLISGVIFANFCYLAFSFRLYYISKINKINLSFFNSYRIYLESMFYYFLMPMGVGLEVSRFGKIYALRKSMSKNKIFSFLLSDRLWGMLGSLLLCVILLPFVNLSKSTPLIHFSPPIWATIILGFFIAATLLFISKKVKIFLQTLVNTLKQQANHLIRLLIVSAFCQVLQALAILLIADSLQLQATFIDILFASSLALMFAVIPVSFAGISSVEGANLGLLIALGYSYQVSLILVGILYGIKLFSAVQGGICEFMANLLNIKYFLKSFSPRKR